MFSLPIKKKIKTISWVIHAQIFMQVWYKIPAAEAKSIRFDHLHCFVPKQFGWKCETNSHCTLSVAFIRVFPFSMKLVT